MWISIHAQSMDESINYMVDEEKTVVINLARLRSLERLWHVCTSSVVAVNLYYRSKKRLRGHCARGAWHQSARIDENSASVLSLYGYIVALRTPLTIVRMYIYIQNNFNSVDLLDCNGEYINLLEFIVAAELVKLSETIQVHLLCIVV